MPSVLDKKYQDLVDMHLLALVDLYNKFSVLSGLVGNNAALDKKISDQKNAVDEFMRCVQVDVERFLQLYAAGDHDGLFVTLSGLFEQRIAKFEQCLVGLSSDLAVQKPPQTSAAKLCTLCSMFFRLRSTVPTNKQSNQVVPQRTS